MAVRDIGEIITDFRKERDISQKELAAAIPLDRTYLNRIESGERDWPEKHDASLARVDWRLALHLADERSGGYIPCILDDLPDIDLHPAALKEWLQKELRELQAALEDLIMATHLDPERKKQAFEKIWHELRDVQEVAAVYQGVIEEKGRLDRNRLISKHTMQRKNGER